MSASTARDLSKQWTGRLASYRRHRNDEHLQALVEEALRYCGFCLENDLTASSYWGKMPLSRRVAVLLYLVDHGIVDRKTLKGRRVFIPLESAEDWIISQPALIPYFEPTLELIAALRREHGRRIRPSFS